MCYDYSKLAGKIKECFGNQANFANAMGLSERTLSLTMNCIRAWKQPEIVLACSLLQIPIQNISEYFFKQKVQRD